MPEFFVPPFMNSPMGELTPDMFANGFRGSYPFPSYFPPDYRMLTKAVGKTKSRRATGKTSYDPSGKKVITAATCVACFKSKKRCIYRLGADRCVLCDKRNQECVKRVDRRCQKVWNETGRTMIPQNGGKGKKAQVAAEKILAKLNLLEKPTNLLMKPACAQPLLPLVTLASANPHVPLVKPMGIVKLEPRQQFNHELPRPRPLVLPSEQNQIQH